MKCPQPETLLELISIPDELSGWHKFQLKRHTFFCEPCQERLESLRQSWQSYLVPEPDITSSLMRVYSRLQKDETLILKGWKIGDNAHRKSVQGVLIKEGWLFRGAIAAGLAVAVSAVMLNRGPEELETQVVSHSRHVPLAQIRVQSKNNVKVHYLEPELLQTVEFETTSHR